MLDSQSWWSETPFVRISESASTARDGRSEAERRLRAILEARPSDEQLRVLGEPSLKAARVLGEPRLATKSVAGLAFFGDDCQYDPEAVRKANREFIEERKRKQTIAAEVISASLGMPTKEQLHYPPTMNRRPVPMKALAILGDDDLSMVAKMQLPPNVDHPAVKAMKIFGSASALAPVKARKVLGPSDDDGEARALADRHWKEEMIKRAEEFNREIIARRPSPALRSIPLDNGPLPAKALQFFGDEDLRRKSLRALKTRAPPKAIHILGDPTLAGSKAALLTGAGVEEVSTGPKRKFSNPLISYRKLFRYAVGGPIEAS